MLVAEERGIAKSSKLLLRLTHERVEARLHVWELIANVAHEHLIERLGEVLGAASVRNVLVGGVRAEKLLFGPSCCEHRDIAVNVLLRTVDDANKAELERIDAASENVERMGALIHQVELGQNTNGATTLRIDSTS